MLLWMLLFHLRSSCRQKFPLQTGIKIFSERRMTRNRGINVVKLFLKISLGKSESQTCTKTRAKLNAISPDPPRTFGLQSRLLVLAEMGIA